MKFFPDFANSTMRSGATARPDARALPLRRLRWLQAISTVLVLSALALFGLSAWIGLQKAERHTWHKIEVSGDTQHNNVTQVHAVVMQQLGTGFFTQDLGDVQNSVLALPWVRRVQVSRVYPDVLRLHIEEHRASAIWGLAGNERLLNTHGEVFEASAEQAHQAATQDLPRLVGSDNQSHTVWQAYLQLKPVLEAKGSNLTALELGAQGLWRMATDNGTRIELGRGEAPELRERVGQFLESLPKIKLDKLERPLQLKNVHSADLRYPNGYALQIKHL